MKYVLLALTGIAVLAGIYTAYTMYQVPAPTPVQTKSITVQHTPTPSFTPFQILTPPAQSMTGKITHYEGDILREDRVATEPSKLTGSMAIVQGERLITQENASATIVFGTDFSFNVDEKADLSFIQTLPVDFVVQQTSGTVDYKSESATPLSIRVRNALIAKPFGTIRITLTDGDSIVLLESLTGPTTIGFNDEEFITRVFDLREGEVYEYNSDEKTVINVKNL